ncbi:MAG: hypothetical protein KDG89_10470 [Geminicoccaceae bacterium]|nr:hypothetical protein [Geminicoccaceae bacterium]
MGDGPEARAILAAAEGLEVRVRLVLDEDAAALAGPAVAGAIQATLPRPLLIPCGDRAGYAQSALAHGGRVVVFDGPEPVRLRLDAIARMGGGRALRGPIAADLRPPPDLPPGRLAAWLKGALGLGPGPPLL